MQIQYSNYYRIHILILCSVYTLKSQTTYFNVPSFINNNQGDIYIQTNLFTSNSFNRVIVNGVYRVLKNTDIGAVIINHSNATWTGVSIQHMTKINPDYSFIAGGVYVPFCSGLCIEDGYYMYGLVSSSTLINKAHFNAGVYYGNEHFFRNNSKIGLMAGADFSLLNGKVILKAEIMSGNNLMSGVNIGGNYFISQNLIVGIGVNLITPNPNNKPLIIQLIFNK
ncbi:MAG: hypothetical protein ACK5HB_08100 [Ignavibacteria bacterium]|jgi:hypothetical protein